MEKLKHSQIFDEVNMPMIHQERHKDDECKTAKQVELKKLEYFGAFKVVKDLGKHIITSTWIIWTKEDKVRARLCTQGFQETEEIPSGSPTVEFCY